MNRLLAILLCGTTLCTAAAASERNAPADQFVNALRRLPARATSYSYSSEQDALAGDRTLSRIQSLDGMWNSVSPKTSPEAPRISGSPEPT